MKAGARLVSWRTAFDARAPRERLLLIAAAVALVWTAADLVWITPAVAQWKAARVQVAQAAAALSQLHSDIARQGAEQRAAEQQTQAELAQWRARVAANERALSAAGASLVSAGDMVPMLERLLARHGTLRLRSMHTVAPGPAGAAAGASAPPAAALYRHGVELSVEGGYGDLVGYVQAIEGLPQRVLWGGLELKVEQYPTVVLTLRLYTLSLDDEWIRI